MKHTSGPWIVVNTGQPHNYNRVARINALVDVGVMNDIPVGDSIADAYLIAAAPDLLVACEAALELTLLNEVPQPWMVEKLENQCRAAIVKARGSDENSTR